MVTSVRARSAALGSCLLTLALASHRGRPYRALFPLHKLHAMVTPLTMCEKLRVLEFTCTCTCVRL